jgi:hypothetical protein
MEKRYIDKTIDKISFQLGMINCFVEMVACGVKKLALSPPLTPEDYDTLAEASNKMTEEFKIYSYLEKSLLLTYLQSEDFTRGKWSILYYKDEAVLDRYLQLKSESKKLETSGIYTKAAKQEISREFMRLLSYPDHIIEEKIYQAGSGSPFMLISEEEKKT